jgi:hypothetical protein
VRLKLNLNSVQGSNINSFAFKSCPKNRLMYAMNTEFMIIHRTASSGGSNITRKLWRTRCTIYAGTARFRGIFPELRIHGTNLIFRYGSRWEHDRHLFQSGMELIF